MHATKDIPIPQDAAKISLKIEREFPPKTWTTAATRDFDEPVKQLYLVGGAGVGKLIFEPKVDGPLPPE
jgi:hypothetical protein